MRKSKLLLFFIIILKITGSPVYGQAKEFPLWENIPDAIQVSDYSEKTEIDKDKSNKIVRNVSVPTLTAYFADERISNGTAVIICPGGSYSLLSMNKEGYQVAEWLNSLGVHAFVLKYRLPNDLIMKNKTVGPLQDAQQAVRLVKRNAGKWNINKSKIGIMGFSAGGHLATTLSTHYNDKVYAATDTISAKPNFSILIYPVISMQGGTTHPGSRKKLLGENPQEEIINYYSNDKQVNPFTPKAFLVHSSDDKAVPVENSINYYLALKKEKVAAELHLYENGGHGFGLGRSGTNQYWPKNCENWLMQNGYILSGPKSFEKRKSQGE